MKIFQQEVATFSTSYRKHFPDTRCPQPAMENSVCQSAAAAFLAGALVRRFPLPKNLAPCSRASIYTAAIAGSALSQETVSGRQRRELAANAVFEIEYPLRNTYGLTRFKKTAQLLKLLAAHSGTVLNHRQICTRLSTTAATLSDYLAALQAMDVITTISAWYEEDSGLGSKTPKVIFTDSALAARLLGIDAAAKLLTSFRLMDTVGATLVKTWAYNELLTGARCNPHWSVYHVRHKVSRTIDFLLTDDVGRHLGIEIKAAESINPGDFRNLRWFAQRVPNFTGLVMYAGTQLLSFGNGCYAVPFSALWAQNEAPIAS